MVAEQKSTNVRSFSPEGLDELAELFFQPRQRYPVPAGWPPAGAQPLTASAHGEALQGWAWGSGPSILLVHGWEGAAAQLHGLGDALVLRGRRVVAFDLPAHGASTGRWTSLPRMADALQRISAQHGPFEAVAAHSLGGGAVVLGELPVPRLLLLAPAAEPGHFIRTFSRMIGVPEEHDDAVFAAISRKVGKTPEQLYLPEVMKRFTGEVLVLHDPADREVPLAHGKALADAAPRGTLVPLAGVGHRRILSDPLALAAAVDFLVPAPPFDELIHG